MEEFFFFYVKHLHPLKTLKNAIPRHISISYARVKYEYIYIYIYIYILATNDKHSYCAITDSIEVKTFFRLLYIRVTLYSCQSKHAK